MFWSSQNAYRRRSLYRLGTARAQTERDKSLKVNPFERILGRADSEPWDSSLLGVEWRGRSSSSFIPSRSLHNAECTTTINIADSEMDAGLTGCRRVCAVSRSDYCRRHGLSKPRLKTWNNIFATYPQAVAFGSTAWSDFDRHTRWPGGEEREGDEDFKHTRRRIHWPATAGFRHALGESKRRERPFVVTKPPGSRIDHAPRKRSNHVLAYWEPNL